MNPKGIAIHKVGGIIIKNRKLLITRSKGKDIFVAPGGKPEGNESLKEALIRELQEEVGIEAKEEHLKTFGTFVASGAYHPENTVTMDVFLVESWENEPKPNTEIEELLWLDSSALGTIKIGSIFEHDVIPRLINQNLID